MRQTFRIHTKFWHEGRTSDKPYEHAGMGHATNEDPHPTLALREGTYVKTLSSPNPASTLGGDMRQTNLYPHQTLRARKEGTYTKP